MKSISDIHDSESYEPQQGVGHLVNRVRAELMACIDRELAADERLAEVEASSAYLVVLTSLSQGPAKSCSDLCRQISYDTGAMTRLVARLAKKGLLRRSRTPGDRRVMNLELTHKGRDAIPRLRQCAMRATNRFLKGFTKAEVRQLARSLARMLRNAHC